jgi:hypothetical protein
MLQPRGATILCWRTTIFYVGWAVDAAVRITNANKDILQAFDSYPACFRSRLSMISSNHFLISSIFVELSKLPVE